MSRVDARLREMQFLAWLDRQGSTVWYPPETVNPDTQMIYSLAQDGYINDGSDPSTQVGTYGISPSAAIKLTIGHKGRVRLSELEQQLQVGRDRDDTGILWAKRHVATGLAIDVLSASEDTPLSVVFLDMNDLGLINNTHGHGAGDEAIRSFFQTVITTLGARGEAYRNGGDEAVVLLRNTDDDGARKILDVFVRQLSKEVLVLDGAKVEVRLTASCGSASTTDPNEDAMALLKRADAVMYRAKAESKKRRPRVSAHAVGDDGEVVILEPQASAM